MEQQLFRLERIAKLLEETHDATGPAAYAPYAAAKTLIRDLDDYAHDENLDYAIEKIGQLDWSVGAMFGFDIDNGHDRHQHYVWALGALDNLRSDLGRRD